MKVRTEFRLLMMTHNLTKAYQAPNSHHGGLNHPRPVTTAFTVGTSPTAYPPPSRHGQAPTPSRNSLRPTRERRFVCWSAARRAVCWHRGGRRSAAGPPWERGATRWQLGSLLEIVRSGHDRRRHRWLGARRRRRSRRPADGRRHEQVSDRRCASHCFDRMLRDELCRLGAGGGGRWSSSARPLSGRARNHAGELVGGWISPGRAGS